MSSFIKGRIQSFKYAFKGIWFLATTEHAIISQLIIAVLLCLAGLLVGITKTEWLFQLLCIGLVLGIEGLNTAIEALCDYIHPDHNDKIGLIKDISAGAVTFAGIFSFFLICIIYFPYFF